MIYLLCSRDSDTAKALVAELNGIKEGTAKRIRSIKPLLDIKGNNLVVCWGQPGGFVQENVPFKVLNNRHIESKFRELELLKEGGVWTVEFSRNKHWSDSLARKEHHREASDLLAGLEKGDFYTEFTPMDDEFRVHVIKGLVVRIGKKVPRTSNYNLRFRSWNAGWRIAYSVDWRTDELVTLLRGTARRAISAVDYDFGAVDIGIRSHDKRAVVFEVNSAPGLEGGTIERYAEKFMEVHNG